MLNYSKRIELASGTGEIITCRYADTFWSRFIGLMGQPPPPNGEGILIRHCNSIHMFFMRFSIDAVFLDREFTIVKLVRDLAPGRLVGNIRGAWQVLEVEAGNLPESFKEGARLQVRSM